MSTEKETEREVLANLIPLGFEERDGVRNVYEAADRILDSDWLADLLAETRALALRTAAEAGEDFLGNETTSEMAWQYLRLCADNEKRNTPAKEQP